MELLSGIFSVIGLAFIGMGIAGMIKPTWLTDKKTGNVPKRQDTIIGAVFGAIVMFAFAGWISPDKKTDIENTRSEVPRPQSETSIAQEEVKAKDEVKAKVRAFEKEIAGYDAVSALYIENAKAMTKQVGQNVSLGDLYQALQDAQRYAQAGADLVLKTAVPDDLPDSVTSRLKEVKDAYWQMFIGRRDAMNAFMDWVDIGGRRQISRF